MKHRCLYHQCEGDARSRILRAFFLAISARDSWASSKDLNFITPRGYTRGASIQYRAQCLRNRSNPFPRETVTGAAFISSPERYFSTAKLLRLHIEMLPQSLRILSIQRPNRILLEPVQRTG